MVTQTSPRSRSGLLQGGKLMANDTSTELSFWEKLSERLSNFGEGGPVTTTQPTTVISDGMRAAVGSELARMVSFPVSELAVTPADIDGTGRPEVESGDYQVQVGNQTANFSITG